MTIPSFTFPLVDVPPSPTGHDNVQQQSAIRTLKASFLTDSADGDSLKVIGGNYGVPPPPGSTDAELMRRLIPVLAWQPKTILFTTYNLMTAIFGSQHDLLEEGQRPWKIFEINANEFVIEFPLSLVNASNETATYLHGATGYAPVVSGPTNTFTAPGNLTASSATTLVGKDIQIFFGGVWNSYTITAAVYNSGPDTTQITVSASTIPTGGGIFVITVPGDDVSSYAGDYLASSEYGSSFTTAAGPDTNTISVLGDATTTLAIGHVVVLTYGIVQTSYTINSLSYSTSTNRTTIVVNASTVSGGVTSGSITKEIEFADTSSTPTHNLRAYFTGLGLLSTVTYYMDLLVRAAGVVMRVEFIT